MRHIFKRFAESLEKQDVERVRSAVLEASTVEQKLRAIERLARGDGASVYTLIELMLIDMPLKCFYTNKNNTGSIEEARRHYYDAILNTLKDLDGARIAIAIPVIHSEILRRLRDYGNSSVKVQLSENHVNDAMRLYSVLVHFLSRSGSSVAASDLTAIAETADVLFRVPYAAIDRWEYCDKTFSFEDARTLAVTELRNRRDEGSNNRSRHRGDV